MKIGVLGGTFDPVHYGHLKVAEEVEAHLGLDEVIFVPVYQPPLKSRRPVASAEHRAEMVRLAIAGKPGFSLSTAEIERGGISYTVDTMSEFRARFGPEADIYFIMGWDSLAVLPKWREPARLITLCRLVAVPRPGYSPPDLKKLEAHVPGLSQRVTLMDSPRINISATEIRKRLAKGWSVSDTVPPEAEKYILEHKLYRGGQT